MATVNYRLRSKLNKTQPIYIYISLSKGNTISKVIPLLSRPDEWSKKTKLPIPKLARNKRLKNDLEKFKRKVEEDLNNDIANNVLIDSHWLSDKIKTNFSNIKEKADAQAKQHYIKEFLKDFIKHIDIKQFKGKNTPGASQNTKKNYESTLALIEEYEDKKKTKIKFSDLSLEKIEELKSWMKEQEYAIGTIGHYLKMIKSICNKAKRSDILVHQAIFETSKITKANEDKVNATITFDEIELIKKQVIPNNHLENARKWTLLGLSIGQRVNDLLNLKKTDIRRDSENNAFIDIQQIKTKKDVTIPIMDYEILELLDNDFPTKISEQKFNQYLKEVCKLCGISQMIEGEKSTMIDKETKRIVKGIYPKHELISSHDLRRSYLTNHYNIIPTSLLRMMSGHSTEKQLLEYINRPENKDENAKLFIKIYKEWNTTHSKTLRAV